MDKYKKGMVSIGHKNFPVFIPHLACKNDCVFCNQKKIAGTLTPLTPDEVKGLLEEGLTTLTEDTQIAFFGGSFTGLSLSEMRCYLDAASPFVRKGGYSGIRLSTRPDYITSEILSVLNSYPVQTIELGVQSLDDNVLKQSNRGHTAEDVRIAVSLIRKFGFTLILQMMTGLPGSTAEKDLETAKKIVLLQPDGVRIYPTVVVKETALYQSFLSGNYTPQTIEEAVELCAKLLQLFEKEAIHVIRLGLHADSGLTEGENIAAGPFHPAFGELCQSKIYFDLLSELIDGKAYHQFVIYCPMGEVSKVTGQKRDNIEKLKAKYKIKKISVSEDSRLKNRSLRLIERTDAK